MYLLFWWSVRDTPVEEKSLYHSCRSPDSLGHHAIDNVGYIVPRFLRGWISPSCVLSVSRNEIKNNHINDDTTCSVSIQRQIDSLFHSLFIKVIYNKGPHYWPFVRECICDRRILTKSKYCEIISMSWRHQFLPVYAKYITMAIIARKSSNSMAPPMTRWEWLSRDFWGFCFPRRLRLWSGFSNCLRTSS